MAVLTAAIALLPPFANSVQQLAEIYSASFLPT
jgi:hypothetical protein